MRTVVGDSSCLIDLGKGGLLKALFALPYRFLMPNTLFEDELLSFGKIGKDDLMGCRPRIVKPENLQFIDFQRLFMSGTGASKPESAIS